MKKFVLLIGIAALAACSQAETEAPVAEETVAAVEPAAGTVTPGNYDVTWEDGTKSSFTMNADGTYTSVRDGVTEQGSSAVVDGKICFTPSTEGAEVDCWTNSAIAADGSFTSASDAGQKVSLTVAAAAPAAAAAAAAPAATPAE